MNIIEYSLYKLFSDYRSQEQYGKVHTYAAYDMVFFIGGSCEWIIL